jgi:hypothetical protein
VALAVKDLAQVLLRRGDHGVIVLVVVSECGFLAEKLQADLGQRWQVIGADQPIGDAALGEQAVLELLVAAREALGPGHVHAADGPAFRRADREGAIGAVEQVEPMHAVVRAARHGEAGSRVS